MSKKGICYILPGFIGVLIFYLIPFIMSIYYTFTQGVVDITFVGMDNFVDLLGNDAFRLAAKNTALFILVGVPVLMFLSVYISVKIQGKMPSAVRFAMLSPMIIPAASAAMGWSILLGDMGIINKILNLLNIDKISFLGEGYAMWIFISIYIIKNLGYMVIIFSSTLANMSKEFREVFILDCNSTLKFTTKIVIPEIKPAIFFAVIIAIVNCFQIFREVYVIYGNNPPLNMYILQYFMNNNFMKLNYQRLSTAAFIVIAIITVFVALYLIYAKRQAKERGIDGLFK